MKDETVNTKAYQLLNNGQIGARIEKLQAKMRYLFVKIGLSLVGYVDVR